MDGTNSWASAAARTSNMLCAHTFYHYDHGNSHQRKAERSRLGSDDVERPELSCQSHVGRRIARRAFLPDDAYGSGVHAEGSRGIDDDSEYVAGGRVE